MKLPSPPAAALRPTGGVTSPDSEAMATPGSDKGQRMPQADQLPAHARMAAALWCCLPGQGYTPLFLRGF